MARIEFIKNNMYFDKERLRAAEVGLQVLRPIVGFGEGAKQKFDEVYDVLSSDFKGGISNVTVDLAASNVPELSVGTFFDVLDVDGRRVAAHTCIDSTKQMSEVMSASLPSHRQDPSDTAYAFNEFAPSLITVEESVGNGIVRAVAETALFVHGRDENATPDDQYLAVLETVDSSYPKYLTVDALHKYFLQLSVADPRPQGLVRW